MYVSRLCMYRACVCIAPVCSRLCMYRVLTIPRPEAGGRYTGTSPTAMVAGRLAECGRAGSSGAVRAERALGVGQQGRDGVRYFT